MAGGSASVMSSGDDMVSVVAGERLGLRVGAGEWTEVGAMQPGNGRRGRLAGTRSVVSTGARDMTSLTAASTCFLRAQVDLELS